VPPVVDTIFLEAVRFSVIVELHAGVPAMVAERAAGGGTAIVVETADDNDGNSSTENIVVVSIVSVTDEELAEGIECRATVEVVTGAVFRAVAFTSSLSSSSRTSTPS